MNKSWLILSQKQSGWIAALALAGWATIMAQIGYTLITDQAFCPDIGCEIVASMLKIPPLWFNLAGGTFFLALFILALLARKGNLNIQVLLRVLLLCGLAAEGVLISYQWFVVQVFCSYCIVIFAFILLMNIISGWRQACLGVLIISSQILVFSLLQFNNPALGINNLSLADGTSAIKRSVVPSDRQLFFIFSEDCPHCHNIFEVLKTTELCEVKLNPIHQIEQSPLPDLEPVDSYNLTVNIKILRMLDINTVPVLIEKRNDGVELIRGEKQIISFLQTHCLAPSGEGKEQVEFTTPLLDFGLDECPIGKICNGNEGELSGDELWDFN